jgi:hypothetical protein
MPKCRPFFRSSAAALALGAAMITAGPASADQASLKSMSFDTTHLSGSIRVISTDGKKWNKLAVGTVFFDGKMKINLRWPGYVQDVDVALGICGPGQCPQFPTLWSESPVSRDYSNQETLSFDPATIPLSTNTGIAVVPYGDQIIKKCNEHLQADGPTKSHSFTHQFHASFSTTTDKALSMNNAVAESNPDWPSPAFGAHYTEKDSFDVPVICDPVIKPPTNDIAHDFGEFDVSDVKLFLTTYQNQQPGSNPATVCPSLKVTSRAQANQAGPVTMRIWRQKDGGPITSDVQQAWASYDAGKNGYFATYEKWEDVGTTSYYQFRTEIVDNSVFPPSDGWKDITVHCTNPGGGGFAPEPDDNSDLPKPQAKWQGEVIVADSAGGKKACPRKGQVSFSVSRQAPGDFDYRISCSNGAYFAGTATGFDQGNGMFAAQGAHEISVNKTRSISCTLQELTPAPVTVDTDKEDFTCSNPNFEPEADDIVSTTNPTHDEPIVPPVVADPGKKCLPSQRLLRGKCVDKPLAALCKKNEQRIDGKCVKIPGVSIHCLPGFEQKGLKCIKKPVIATACKAGEIRVDGKCVKKPEVSILCKKGFKLVGKKCVRIPTLTQKCGPTEKLVRGHCVPDRKIGKLKAKTLKGGRKLQTFDGANHRALLPRAKKARRAN